MTAEDNNLTQMGGIDVEDDDLEFIREQK